MNYDVSIPGIRSLISERIIEEINANSSASNPPRHSWRISPSSLGSECVAHEWYKWRAVKKEVFDGRMSRLFKRGHNSENRFVPMLADAGWTVRAVDPARANSFNQQYKVTDFGGHMSGYLDAIGSHPEYSGGTDILLEFKTYNTKRFSIVKNSQKGLKIEDPKYYGQICIYMMKYNLPWCLFFGENKNDDDIHIDIILRDDKTADELMRRAHTIITSKVRPARIAESPAFFACKYCLFVDICHHGAPVENHCRSCLNCTPIEGGNFYCEKWKTAIPKDAVLSPQPCHEPVR